MELTELEQLRLQNAFKDCILIQKTIQMFNQDLMNKNAQFEKLKADVLKDKPDSQIVWMGEAFIIQEKPKTTEAQ